MKRFILWPGGGGGGGISSATRTEESVTQNGHGFSAGDVLYNNNGTFAKARANAAATSRAVGVVESVTTNTFVIVYSGNIVLSGLSTAATYYLSDSTAGLLTTTAPSATSSFLVVILRTGTATLGYVNINYVGSLALAPIAIGGTGASTAYEAFDNLQGAETAVSIAAGVADIGASTSDKVTIGAGTITSFGTKTAGVPRWILFTGAGSITHNATSLICIGGADVAYASGDIALMVSLGSGNWRMYIFRPISALLPQLIAEDVFAASGTPAAATVYYLGFIEGTAWNGLSNAGRFAIPIDWDASVAAMRVSYFCTGAGDGTHSVTVELLYDGTTVLATDTFFMSATGSFRRSLVIPAANTIAAGHFLEARVTYAASFSGPTGVVMHVKWWYKR